MKKLRVLTGTVVVIAGLGVSSQAHAFYSKEYIHDLLVGMCHNAMNDKMLRLNRKIKSHRLTMRKVSTRVVCNGLPISEFAAKYGADRVSARLARYLPKGRPQTRIRDIEVTRNAPPLSTPDPQWSVSFSVAK